MKIKIDEIKVDPQNPRQHINEESLKSLAQSLATEGLIQPIEVDKNKMIIVGEMRFRAAKSLGWKEIEANVFRGELTPLVRLRRQLAENLQQSASKMGGESMNPVDTARSWARLYEMSVGRKYEDDRRDRKLDHRVLRELASQVGLNYRTVMDYLDLLQESSVIIDSLIQGLPRSYIDQVNKAPEPLREGLKDMILKGDYTDRMELRREIGLLKSSEDIQQMVVDRKRRVQSLNANQVLNKLIDLASAMEKYPLDSLNEAERGYVSERLSWLRSKITTYLGEEIIDLTD